MTRHSCPECDTSFSSLDATERHRASVHGAPIFSESAVACDDCGRTFKNLNALARHRHERHGVDADTVPEDRAPIYYEQADDEPEGSGIAAEAEALNRSAPSTGGDDERIGPLGWLGAGLYGLWTLAKWGIGLLIIAGIIAAVISGDDEGDEKAGGPVVTASPGGATPTTATGPDTISEVPGSLPYKFVHALADEGAINNYRAVTPANGWTTQYQLNNGDVIIRFRTRGTRRELEYGGFAPPSDVIAAIEAEADQRGFVAE